MNGLDYFDHPENEDNELKGISGWLSVFQAALYISIGLTILQVILLCTHENFAVAISGREGYWLIIFFVIAAVLIGMGIYSLRLMEKGNILFRRIYVIMVVIDIITSIIFTIILFNSMLEGYQTVKLYPLYTKNLILEIGWIAYLYQSRRVQNTFLPDDPETKRAKNDFI